MEPARTSLRELLAGLAGCVAGAAILGYAALAIGMLLLGRVPGGIHSDWSLVVLLATLVCAVAGGIAGAKAAARLVKGRQADSHNRK
jgi:hypothetical protein